MTTTHQPSKRRTHPMTRRLFALSKAESLQFLRNRLLVFISLSLPLAFPLLFHFTGISEAFGTGGISAARTLEIFTLMALLFLQFYSVLSMTTTRRDDKVLKRLRTGEARDREILASLAAPGFLLTIGLTVILSVAIAFLNKTSPITGVITAIAVVLGLLVAIFFALITSSFTNNAEAAQLTSMPVLFLAMLSQASIALSFPTELSDILSRTPFALVIELLYLDWAGAPLEAYLDGELNSSVMDTFEDAGLPLALLTAWTLVLGWLAQRCMRWETNR